MSCSSKSGQKRKLQAAECGKPRKKKMAWDSFTSVEDFGYKFNEEGRLVDIHDGEGFNFYVSDEHWYNQENYEMLGEVVTEYVYKLLQSDDVGLKLLEIPFEKESSILSLGKQKNKENAKGFIFVSEDYDKKEKLLVLVHGSGVVRAGQWARRLIINDCLDHGTQIPYIKRALKEGYGVVVTNTNQNEAAVEIKGKKTFKIIKESESPKRHFTYIWKNVIEKTKASKIFFVAHSYGGYLVVNHFSRFSKIQERAVAVAFTDSVHSLKSDSRGDVRKWFLKNSVNWVTSNEDLDVPMFHQDDNNQIARVSAGTTKHEETSWKAMESVFKYFQEKEVLFDQSKHDGNKKTTDCKSGKSSKKAKQLAINFDSDDKISKESNKNIMPADGCISSEVMPELNQGGRNENKEYSNPGGTNQATTSEKFENKDTKDGMNEYLGSQSQKSKNIEGENEKKDLGDKEKESNHDSSEQNEEKFTTENTTENTSENTSENSCSKPKDVKEGQLKKKTDEVDVKASNENQPSKQEKAATNSEDKSKPEYIEKVAVEEMVVKDVNTEDIPKRGSTMNEPVDSDEIQEKQNKDERSLSDIPATRRSGNDSEQKQIKNDEISDNTQNSCTEQPKDEADKKPVKSETDNSTGNIASTLEEYVQENKVAEKKAENVPTSML